MCIDKVRVLIFPNRNRVRSMFLEFLDIVKGVTQLVICAFVVFIGIMGGNQELFLNEKLFCSMYTCKYF